MAIKQALKTSSVLKTPASIFYVTQVRAHIQPPENFCALHCRSGTPVKQLMKGSQTDNILRACEGESRPNKNKASFPPAFLGYRGCNMCELLWNYKHPVALTWQKTSQHRWHGQGPRLCMLLSGFAANMHCKYWVYKHSCYCSCRKREGVRKGGRWRETNIHFSLSCEATRL